MSGFPATLVVATRSPKKMIELQRMLSDLVTRGLIEVVSVEEAERRFGRLLPEVEEDADTFSGNAEKKARALVEATGLLTLADDSGLCVDAIGGAPGVQSARYSGVLGEGRDLANNLKLLEALKEVPEEDRGASFVCALCLALPSGELRHVEGRCKGRIGYDLRGDGGFGYDPLFLPEEPGIEKGRSYAELSAEEKDGISHRGRAIRALGVVLEEVLGGARG